MDTIIIIGLGNPGEQFKKTWHNIGFLTIENFKLKNEGFSDWKNEKKLLSEISKGNFGNKKIILAKPQTFMNESGKAAKKIINNYQIPVTNLWVVHDDLDIPLGKLKIIKNRGSAGHKGINSIVKELGTKNFVRFRVGTQPKNGKPKSVEKFVLEKFSKEDEKIVKESINKTVEAIEFGLENDVEKAMNIFNKN